MESQSPDVPNEITLAIHLNSHIFTSRGFLAKIKPPSVDLICCIEVIRKDKLQALKAIPKDSSDNTEPLPQRALSGIQFTLGPVEAQPGNMML